MSIGIRGEIKGPAALGSYIKRIKRDLVTRGLIEDLAIEAKKRILQRTSEGKDFRGMSFKPYSQRWRKERSARGRKTSRVDLEFEGRMLAELETKTDQGSATARVYFSNDSEAAKARYHSITGAGKSGARREFFALGEVDKRALEKMVEDHIKGVLAKK